MRKQRLARIVCLGLEQLTKMRVRVSSSLYILKKWCSDSVKRRRMGVHLALVDRHSWIAMLGASPNGATVNSQGREPLDEMRNERIAPTGR